MDVFIARIVHVAEQIFDQLDNESINNCREVAKSWKKCIDNKNHTLFRISNIPSILQNGNTFLHIAAKTGLTEVFENILENEISNNKKIETYRNNNWETPLSIACQYGHSKIIELLLKRAIDSKEYIIKDFCGLTTFQYAYINGVSELFRSYITTFHFIKMKIELGYEKKDFQNVFFRACKSGRIRIAKILILKSADLGIRH